MVPQRGYGDAWGYTEFLLDGARCVVTGKTRTRARDTWRSYHVISVTFLDEAGRALRSQAMPAGRFNAAARPTGAIIQIIN